MTYILILNNILAGYTNYRSGMGYEHILVEIIIHVFCEHNYIIMLTRVNVYTERGKCFEMIACRIYELGTAIKQ
jgi:hypothetical protein